MLPQIRTGLDVPRIRPAPLGLYNMNSAQARSLVHWWPVEQSPKSLTLRDFAPQKDTATGANIVAGDFRIDSLFGPVINTGGGAARFDTGANFRGVASVGVIDPANWGMCCWCRSTDISTARSEVWELKSPMGTFNGYANFGFGNVATQGDGLYATNYPSAYDEMGPVTVTNNEWIHVFLVIDAAHSIMRLYVNGEEAVNATTGETSDQDGGLEDIVLMSSYESYFDGFQGDACDFRVYSPAPHPAVIRQMYSPMTRWELYLPSQHSMLWFRGKTFDETVILTTQASYNTTGQKVIDSVLSLIIEGNLDESGIITATLSVALTSGVTEALVGGLILEGLVSMDSSAAHSLTGPTTRQGDIPLSVLVQNPVLSNLVAQGMVSLASQANTSQIAQAVKNAVTTLTSSVVIAVVDEIQALEETLLLSSHAAFTPSSQATLQVIMNLIADVVKASMSQQVMASTISLSQSVSFLTSALNTFIEAVSLSVESELTTEVEKQITETVTLVIQSIITTQGTAIMQAMMDLGVESSLAESAGRALESAITFQLSAEFYAAHAQELGTIGRILKQVGETLKASSQTGHILKKASPQSETIDQ